MKKSILTCALALCVMFAFSQGKNWKTEGNYDVDSSDFVGSKNKADLNFGTDNQIRMVIDKEGGIAMKDKVIVDGYLMADSIYAPNGVKVGNGSMFLNYTQTGGGQFIPGNDAIQSTFGRILFGNSDITPQTDFSNIRVGIGGTALHKLHISALNNLVPAQMCFTNTFTHPGFQFPAASDGFIVGLEGNTSNAILNQREDAAILFNTNTFPRMQIDHGGWVGIGDYTLVQPQSNLHMFANNTDWFLITTSHTGHTSEDGLKMGINLLNQSCFWQQTNASMRFDTRFENLPMDACRRVEIIGQTINVAGTDFDNVTRVSVSERGEFPITIPRSLLHLGMNTPSNGGGWRNWMDIGINMSGGESLLHDNLNDNMYVGLKFRTETIPTPGPDKAWNDITDAVIAWGDNDGSNSLEGPDNLKFVFCRPYNPLVTFGAESYNGLEVARITPWGNMGIGVNFTNSSQPQRRLDVHDPGDAGPGRPQLRLTQELSNVNNMFGNYTDFQTTGDNNSYDGDGLGPEGHLLINPRHSNEMRTVAINMTDNATLVNPDLALDVNGQVNIRTVEFDDNIDQVLVWDDANGRVMRRDFPTPVGGADDDWYDITNQPPTNINDAKYSNGNTFILPFGTNTIPNINFVKFGVVQNFGWQFGALVRSISGYFRNTYTHQVSFSEAYGLYSEAVGAGCFGTYDNACTNYGGYFRARNAYWNYAGYFDADDCSCDNLKTNIGIYAIAPTECGFAGWFDGNVNYTGSKTECADIKFKKNLIPLSDALSKLREITPYSFTYRTDEFSSINLSQGQHFGIVAQDLETFYPDLVSEIVHPAKYDTLGNMISDTVSYKAINYTELIPILAEGIIELDSAVTILQQTVPPAKPVLVNPAFETQDVPLVCTFTWEPAERATSYILYISTPTGVMALNTTDTFAIVTLPESCQYYRWRVIAYNEAGSSDVSDTWAFGTFSMSPPDAPVLVSPPDSSIDLPLTNTFSWMRSENAEKYRLSIYFDNYPKGSPVLFFETETKAMDTSVIVNLPLYGRKYLWNVTASGCSNNAVSETWHFMTAMPQIPSAPVLISPENGDSLSNIIALRFSWYSADDTRLYNLYVSTTPDKTGMAYNITTADTFTTIYGPAGGTYYWWVNACNDYTCGDNSEIWSFYLYPYMSKSLSDPILSDENYKTNTTHLNDALSKVSQLNGVYFNWNTAQYPELADTSRQIGFIAQDVEQVIPEVVETDAGGVKYVDYSRVVPVLNEAIKELKNENDSLKAVIASYDGRLTLIEDILASCCTETQTRNSSVNVTIETRPVVVPSQNTVLNQNQPNPFKTFTIFTYTLGESGKCELVIEDTYGRTIATLVSEPQLTGNYSVEWEASTQPAGIYFYSLRVNGKVLVKKAIKIE